MSRKSHFQLTTHEQYGVNLLTVEKMTNSKPAFLREAYWQLPGDCSASSNMKERDFYLWITQLLEDEHKNPNLTWDLHVKGEERLETYVHSTFLDFSQTYIDSQIDAAVDDCHHDPVVGADVVIHLATLYSNEFSRPPRASGQTMF